MFTINVSEQKGNFVLAILAFYRGFVLNLKLVFFKNPNFLKMFFKYQFGILSVSVDNCLCNLIIIYVLSMFVFYNFQYQSPTPSGSVSHTTLPAQMENYKGELYLSVINMPSDRWWWSDFPVVLVVYCYAHFC